MKSILRFADQNLRKKFYALQSGNDRDRKLFDSMDAIFDVLEDNVFAGIQIPKRLLPNTYELKYGVKNVWKYNLIRGQRLIYSVASDKQGAVCIVLEWFSHKKYERRFKYS